MRIVVDVMSGDQGPAVAIEGVKLALADDSTITSLHLVGNEVQIKTERQRLGLTDPRVQVAAARFVTLKMDGTQDSDAFQKVFDKYGVVGMPTVLFIDSTGREVPQRITGAVEADEMLKYLESVDRTCSAAIACVARW